MKEVRWVEEYLKVSSVEPVELMLCRSSMRDWRGKTLSGGSVRNYIPSVALWWQSGEINFSTPLAVMPGTITSIVLLMGASTATFQLSSTSVLIISGALCRQA